MSFDRVFSIWHYHYEINVLRHEVCMYEYTKRSVVVALSASLLQDARALVHLLHPYVWGFKIGFKSGTAIGVPKLVHLLKKYDMGIFLDLKFHDVPETVGEAVREADDLGVDMVSVHGANQSESIAAAVENADDTKVLLVTALTSMENADVVSKYGVQRDEWVRRVAIDGEALGVDGIISAVRDLGHLRCAPHLARLIRVTPAIRPLMTEQGGHAYVATPLDAVRAGSDYLVIGSPITTCKEENGGPLQMLRSIDNEMAQGERWS